MLQAKNLKKYYSSKASKKFAVNDISFEFPEKGLFAIFGKSGSGKTTLMNLLGGMEYPNSGKVLVDGQELGKNVDKIRNSKMAYIFQNYYLEKGFTVEEIVKNGLTISGHENNQDADEKVTKSLELVGMNRFRKKRGDALSGGQKQRVAVARALAKNTNIIFADEPTGNLDSINTHKLMAILKEIAKDKLVIIVTHEVNLIEEYADDYIEIVDGKINDKKTITLLNSNSQQFDGKCTLLSNVSPLNTPRTAKTGQLFNVSNIKKLDHDGHRGGGIGGFLKQIFNAILAVAFVVLSFACYNMMTSTLSIKDTNNDNFYVSLNSYRTLRSLDETLYDKIDFFETNYRSGKITSQAYVTLPSITVEYEVSSIEDTINDDDILFGSMPSDGEILISNTIANQIISEIQIDELANESHVLNMVLDSKYTIAGIVNTNDKCVYMKRQDYVNFIDVYSMIQFVDSQNIFFKSGYDEMSFTAQIKLADYTLTNEQVDVEINRSSLYKMMSVVGEADVLVEDANKEISLQSMAIAVSDSKVYVRKFSITRDIMSTDIYIYVNQDVLDNIFTYIAPSIETLQSGSLSELLQKNYFFEIVPALGMRNELYDILEIKDVAFVNVNDIYKESLENISTENLQVILYTLAMLLIIVLIYYFMEKSSSIKTAKEYGVYRAIGVSRSNLLFKEFYTIFKGNMVSYFIFVIISIVLVSIWLLLSSMTVMPFVLASIVVAIVGGTIMLGVGLIPFLFVLYQSPANILSKFDI